MEPTRDRVFGLLADLCGAQVDLSSDTLRLLSHTLLGAARDASPAALFAVRDALPWVAAFVELGDGTDPEAITDMLLAYDVPQALDRGTILSRMVRTIRTDDGQLADGADDSHHSHALQSIAALDGQLDRLSRRPDHVVRDTLMGCTELLAAAVSVCSSGAQNEVARTFRRALMLDDVVVDVAPLGLLSDVQNSWDAPALAGRSNFSERSIRFELSAAEHLENSGMMPALRSALLYGGLVERDLRRKLREFDVFAQDRSLEDLAVALATVRRKALAYLGGRTPLRSLEPWVRYLRTGCHELADVHDVTIREATSLAHFCLHLLNFCDLTIDTDGVANDEARFAMMHVEDELKAFALEGQRAGLSDHESNLATRESFRWEGLSAREQLVERVALLSGGWRCGFVPTASGVSRLEEQVTKLWRDAVEELAPSDETVALTNTALATMKVRGAELFELAKPAHAIRLLVMAAVQGRGHGTLDFEPVLQWYRNDERRTDCEVLLDLMDDALLRHRSGASSGFVAYQSDHGVTLRVQRQAEMEALLVVLRSAELSPLMRELARTRVVELLAVVSRQEPRRESQPTPVVGLVHQV